MLNILPTIDEDTIVQTANKLDRHNFKLLLDNLNSNYHNEEELVSNKTFDILVDLYESKFGPYQVIGAEPNVPKGEKVILPYFLSGLKKIKEEHEISLFSSNYPGGYVLMDKADGITLLLTHSSNGVNKLYTRGGGTKGVDVSHLLDYIRLPPLNFNFDIAIRGELVINKEVFGRIGQVYKNARNMLTGKALAKKSFNPDIARELSFYVYRILNASMTPEQDVQYLTNLGFLVPTPVVTPNINKEILEPYLALRKEQAPYEIDGLVVYQNAIIEYPVGSNPKSVVAYKEETETAVATVTNVIWQSSRGRRLKPVVIYESVYLSGADLTNATGHNGRFIVENGIGPGAIIKITRSGDTIPKVLLVVEPSPQGPSYPDPNVVGQYTWNENQVEFILLADNDEVLAAKLEHFLNILEIDKVGPGRVKLLVQAGIKDITALLAITPNQLISIEGFGDKLSNQIYNDLHEKIKNVPLAKLMDASGIFHNIGVKRAELILDVYPNLIDLAYSNPNNIAEYISAINGFGPLLADEVATKLPVFITWWQQHPQITIGVKQQVILQQVTGKRLDGYTIVFSGTRDKNLQQEITSRGGKVGSTVSKSTTMLVMQDVSDLKGKGQKALKLNIPIISKEEFKMQYL